ncbi:MerR family transcriptional regulator [Kocuria sp.]|uniref:MerR family transcriptional regulator n=1 Tax=Kocuria sp. TaxID=1871328 RepID=UPI000DB0E230|nr:MerR family transcriptional regulator [Kocuria sp.]MDO5368319.1 MerR family transcriptional regulator [Kocuria sp.]PZP32266.1 MAG: hypothetical protein DI613_08250 [Kocuria rhizophila]
MRISEVSARSGVPATTLRYYESIGLLTPQRSDNGYRVYDEHALERLAFIDAAKSLGLELPEIKDLLELADSGTCTKVKAALHPLLTEQLAQVEDSLAKLNRLHEHLTAASRHVVACPDSPERCRSECAFLVLSEGPGQRWIDDDGRARRRSHWQEILQHGPVSDDGDSLVVEVPLERLLEISALARIEHDNDHGTTFTLQLEGGRCIMIISAQDRSTSTVFDALRGGERGELASP